MKIPYFGHINASAASITQNIIILGLSLTLPDSDTHNQLECQQLEVQQTKAPSAIDLTAVRLDYLTLVVHRQNSAETLNSTTLLTMSKTYHLCIV